MSAKSKETTKTAHVMNLLKKHSGGAQPADPEGKQAPDAGRAEPAAAQERPVYPQHPIIASLNEEAAVALEIKGALEQELMDSESVSEPKADSGHLQTEPPSTQPEEADERAEVMSDPVPEAPASTESDAQVQQEPAGAAQPVVTEAGRETVPDIEIYNVMQAMVEDGAEKYMKMFNLCTCVRCKADVRALALNNLQPKYVVMRSGEYIPRITVYEQQFSAAVTAQILRACTVVAESPRHDDLR